MLSEHLIVPAMEKLLADGSIEEYEIDEAAIHTTAPGLFSLSTLRRNRKGSTRAGGNHGRGEAHVLGSRRLAPWWT